MAPLPLNFPPARARIPFPMAYNLLGRAVAELSPAAAEQKKQQEIKLRNRFRTFLIFVCILLGFAAVLYCCRHNAKKQEAEATSPVHQRPLPPLSAPEQRRRRTSSRQTRRNAGALREHEETIIGLPLPGHISTRRKSSDDENIHIPMREYGRRRQLRRMRNRHFESERNNRENMLIFQPGNVNEPSRRANNATVPARPEAVAQLPLNEARPDVHALQEEIDGISTRPHTPPPTYNLHELDDRADVQNYQNVAHAAEGVDITAHLPPYGAVSRSSASVSEESFHSTTSQRTTTSEPIPSWTCLTPWRDAQDYQNIAHPTEGVNTTAHLPPYGAVSRSASVSEESFHSTTSQRTTTSEPIPTRTCLTPWRFDLSH